MTEQGEKAGRTAGTGGEGRDTPPEAQPVLPGLPEPEDAGTPRPGPIPQEARREEDLEEPSESRVLELERRLGQELGARQDRELEQGTERRLQGEIERVVEARVRSALELEIESEIGRQLGPPPVPRVVDLAGSERVPFARVLPPPGRKPAKRVTLKNRETPVLTPDGREGPGNGRLPGQVKGRGLRNRRGLSNGNGLTNAGGMVNGRRLAAGGGRAGPSGRRARANGELVDAEGAVNGRGMVNGRGIINGEDLTTGRAHAMGEAPPGRRRSAGTVIAAAVVVIMLSVAGLYFVLLSTEKGVHIDGAFSDWSGVPRMPDDIADCPDPDINIVEQAMVADGSSVSVYLRFEGKALAGTGGGVDSVYAFFDTDQDTATGYRIDSVGAESVLIIDGYDGRVSAAGLYRFGGDGGRPANDWNSRTATGACRAAAAGSELEAQAGGSDLGLSAGARLNIFVLSSNGRGAQDQAPVMSNERARLAAVWSRTGPESAPPGADSVPLLRLELKAFGGPASVSSLTVRAAGALSDGDLARIALETAAGFEVPGATGRLAGGALTIALSPAIAVTPGTATVLSVVGDLSGAAATGRAVGLGLDGSRDIGADTRAVSVEAGALPLTYIGAPSRQIVIDGAFSDWDGYPEHPDPAGDVDAPGMDILGFRTASDGGSLYINLRVDGRIMGGTGVPERKLRPPPTPGTGGGGPVVLPPLVGVDSAFVFVDTDGDPATGYAIGGLPVGAEYMANCTGQYGRVLQKGLHRFTGTGRADWSWAPAGDIEARTDEHRLEAGLPLASLGSPGGNITLFYYTTDWSLQRDRGEAVVHDLAAGGGGRGSGTSPGTENGPGAPASGRDIQPLHAPEFRDALVPLLGMASLFLALRRRRRRRGEPAPGRRMDY
ncbi:MAG: hypothetical protein FJ149_04935 [Euryarchaeota archaeon]|nr:hypothetical protein [Euryarchaeota archaeon]